MNSSPNGPDILKDPGSNSATVRAASSKVRVFVFRDFLWETYGSYLTPGDLVLDVAGGKGDLSWLFENVDDLKSVVVDPRSLSSQNHLIRSVHWLSDHPDECRKRAIPDLPTHQPLAALIPEILERKEKRALKVSEPEYLAPRHLKMKLNNDVVKAIRKARQEPVSSDGCPPSWRTFWSKIQEENTTNELVNGDALFLPESERKSFATTTPIQAASEAWKVLQKIRLITAFHPDSATEACVDLAGLLRIPLCIVPCCVFPSEFPDRKVAVQEDSGKVALVRVRDHQLFIRYLQHKQPQLRKKLLPFHFTGTPLKNVALYTLPEDIQ